MFRISTPGWPEEIASIGRPDVACDLRGRASLHGEAVGRQLGFCFVAWVEHVEPVDEEARAWWVEQGLR